MRMWGAGLGFAAVQAVTGDKKPVTIPFLGGREYLSGAPISGHLRLDSFSRHCDEGAPRSAVMPRHIFPRGELKVRSVHERFDPAKSRRRRGLALERTNHDKNEMRYRHTRCPRIGGCAARRNCPVVGRCTKQHAPKPRRADTTRHIWKFGTDCGDGHRAVGRNVQSAVRWRHKLGP
jgi:hypothetical protein